MKIVELRAENVKRLKAVEIRPDGNLVEITGANGQGKSSILDSIWWALAGTRTHQSMPIRTGETEARIKLDMGEIVVRRQFKLTTGKKEGAEERLTTTLVVESQKGARYLSPQAMLDDLLGSLAFDPLAFARADGKVQFETLRGFITDVDFDGELNAIKRDHEERQIENRTVKQKRWSADQIEVPDNAPDKMIDLQELVDAMSSAQEDNHSRADSIKAMDEARRVVAVGRTEARVCDAEVDLLKLKIAAKEERSRELTEEADRAEHELDKLIIPDAIDYDPIRDQIAASQQLNGAYQRKQRKSELEGEAAAAEERAATLTAAMKKRADAMKKAVEEADMPVAGLSLGDGEVFLNGIPLSQASDAEQLRLSCAVAMRQKSELRVIRVRDGSLLDEKSLEILREMADAEDFQVWIERVDTSGTVGFVIEDGAVKQAPEGEPADG